MSTTSEAINNILESIAQLPEQDRRLVIETADKQFHAQISHLSVAMEAKKLKNGKAISDIFQDMAERKALPHISDPSVWQRKIRKDRPLPDRESQ